MSALAQRHGNTYAMIMCDLDHFKSVNDRYGHIAGDKILVAFSNMLGSLLRDSDIAARIGGEEFILLLHNTNLENLEYVCERLINETRKLQFQDIDKSLLVTTSIGGVVLNDYTTTFDTAFSLADKNLYAAKGAGRNQYFVTLQQG